METTFDKFINSNPKRRAEFDKEYNDFLLSEYVLENKMNPILQTERLILREFIEYF